MPRLKMLVFTEGTIIMHKNAKGHSRKEIVKQVKENEKSVHDYSSYISIGKAAKKLRAWRGKGVLISYLTSRKKPKEVKSVHEVLKKHGFPKGRLLFRKGSQQYKDIAEKIVPDILIEDNCESIGGIKEMTVTHIKPKIKKKIKSIVLREFGGIDSLPDSINRLRKLE